MERTRDLVFEASVGQQIARQLLNDELIVWKIAIERVNHPVAVRPDSRPFVVLFISFCVCVARQVQPDGGPSLAVAWRCQQPINLLFISVRGVIS